MTNHGVGGSSSSWQDSSSLEHWGTLEEATRSGAYWQSQGTDMEDDSGIETDTSSDSGREELDMSDLSGLNNGEASAHTYWQYRLHKRKRRRFSGKPARKLKRIHKRFRTANCKEGFPDKPWEPKEIAEDSHSSMSKYSTRPLLSSVENAKATEGIRQAKALDVG